MAPRERSAETPPTHVAVIMDGNGRWAERQGLARSDGHRAGVDTVRSVTRAARDRGIRWLTLYAFSSENWRRPKDEVEVLMSLPEAYFSTELADAQQNDVRIRTIGRRDRLPPSARASVEQAVEETRGNSGMQLVFALSYGGRQEIVDAARRLLQAGSDPDALDEKTLAAQLDDPELPDVDLLIRTGGEKRISNFLIWQTAYAEIVFSEKLWPEFGPAELDAALAEYHQRERRFGQTSAQLAPRGTLDSGRSGES